MKIKTDFVTNSSSTSYLIKNISKTDMLTARSFVESIWPHIQDKMRSYDFNYTKEELIQSLNENYDDFPLLPLQEKMMRFGDQDDTIVGEVFDYVLRDGIITGLTSVKFEELLR